MGGEPGDHRNAEPVHEPVQVIGELVQLGTIDAGIDQDQPTLSAHHDGIAPDPRALPDPDALGHLIQHRFNLSVISARHNHGGQEMVGLDQPDPCWRPADSDPDYTLDREEPRNPARGSIKTQTAIWNSRGRPNDVARHLCTMSRDITSVDLTRQHKNHHGLLVEGPEIIVGAARGSLTSV
jgi:hypothetical protein